MKGGKNKQPLGYTIVEVMVVLAVSGVMFLIASQFINGQQEKAAFNSGVNTMATNLQGMIQQVSSGRYSDIPLYCVLDNNKTKLDFSATQTGQQGGRQGANSNCAFLGKVIQFDYGNVQNKQAVYTIAGYRFDTSQPTKPATALRYAAPTAVGAPTLPGQSNSFDLTVLGDTPNSLNVTKVTIDAPGGKRDTDYGPKSGEGGENANIAIAFLQSLGNADGQSNFQAGGQTTSMYWIQLVANDTELAAASQINSSSNGLERLLKNGQLPIVNSVTWCVSDGTQNAEINIGTSNQTGASTTGQLSVDVKRDGPNPCA